MSIEIPETFDDVTDDVLSELDSQITARSSELADTDATDEVLAELAALADARDKIRGELSTREADRTARAARREELMNRLAAEGGPTPAVEFTEETPAEAAPAAEESIIPETPNPEPVVAAAVDPGFAEAVKALTDTVAAVKDLVEATAPGASMSSLRPAGAAPVRPRSDADGPMVLATKLTPGKDAGSRFGDLSEVADAILDKWSTFGQAQSRIPAGVAAETHPVAQIVAPRDNDRMLVGDFEHDFGVIRRVQMEHASLVASGDQALVASSCAPFAPIYSFFRLASPQNPIEASLPSLQAPRGGIRYIVPPSYTDPASGIGWRTSAEDADSNTADFPVVTVTCPQVQDAAIEMVARRVRWKNLNHRAFPEQVEAFTSDLMVMFTKSKEVRYLDAIQTGSTAAAGIARYGAARSLLYDLHVSAINYRHRQNMGADSTLQVILPDWSRDLIRRDIAAASSRLEAWQVSNAMIEDMIRALGLAPTFSYYAPTNVSGGDFSGALANLDGQAGNDIRDFPTSVAWFMFAPGTFIRIDAGTLDVGPVRDSALNGSNELELFAEEWTRVVKVGIESVAGTSSTKANGALPPAAAALVPA